jgi:hypothetical protein
MGRITDGPMNPEELAISYKRESIRTFLLSVLRFATISVAPANCLLWAFGSPKVLRKVISATWR